MGTYHCSHNASKAIIFWSRQTPFIFIYLCPVIHDLLIKRTPLKVAALIGELNPWSQTGGQLAELPTNTQWS